MKSREINPLVLGYRLCISTIEIPTNIGVDPNFSISKDKAKIGLLSFPIFYIGNPGNPHCLSPLRPKPCGDLLPISSPAKITGRKKGKGG